MQDRDTACPQLLGDSFCREVEYCPEDDIGGHPRFRGTRECVVPSASPTDWLQLVNQPQTEAEVAALRCGVNRGRPFGDPNWVTDTAKRLGAGIHGSAPWKGEETVVGLSQYFIMLDSPDLVAVTFAFVILQIWWLSPLPSCHLCLRPLPSLSPLPSPSSRNFTYLCWVLPIFQNRCWVSRPGVEFTGKEGEMPFGEEGRPPPLDRPAVRRPSAEPIASAMRNRNDPEGLGGVNNGPQ